MPNPKWVNTEFDQCVSSSESVRTFNKGSLLEHNGDHRRQTLFFCGHSKHKCLLFNGTLPLQLAKRNVEKDYAVVGACVGTNITLTVLEDYIPHYFQGALNIYYMGLDKDIQNINPSKP
uniref:Uncharacterized protein n=1 Tax=Glossina morsitans morsitans TaxID=37546 RepID=A0A1B0GD34_GLOMM